MSDSVRSERSPESSAPDIPENPLGSPRNMRRLKMAIAIMSTLLVVGTLVVIGTIIYRVMTLEGNKIAEPVTEGPQGFTGLDVEVEPGTLVTRIEMDGDRMAVHVTREAGDEILLIDIRNGKLIGRINLRKPGSASQGN